MGVVAQGGQGASVLQRPSPAERARSRVAAALPARDAPALPAAASPLAPEPVEPLLRARLRLTPTASDDEFKAVFDAAGGPAPAAEEPGWTWKELLTTLDAEGEPAADGALPEPAAAAPAAPPAPAAPVDEARLGEALYQEIETMGIDPLALLTKGRIEEIAAAVQTGDAGGAREVVRTLAPAAIRRIARRMLADAVFRGRAQALNGRYGELIAQAARRDPQGAQAAALLATHPGRAYLLLDAAAGQSG
jgi:hypothetical protein